MQTKEYNDTLIVIPTYQEALNIEDMINLIFSLYPTIHLLIIDDNSPDKTADIIKKNQKSYSNLHLLERSGKLGLGSAYKMGLQWGVQKSYQFVVQMDADFSHDAKDIASMILKLKEGNDLVIGSRYINGLRVLNWPIERLILSYGASIYARLITRLPLIDTTGGFKCYTKKALETIPWDKIKSNGFAFQLEINFHAWIKGLKIFEHPITFSERKKGNSKMNRKIIVEGLLLVLKLKLKHILKMY